MRQLTRNKLEGASITLRLLADAFPEDVRDALISVSDDMNKPGQLSSARECAARLSKILSDYPLDERLANAIEFVVHVLRQHASDH